MTAPSPSSLAAVPDTEPVEPPFSPTPVVELVRLLAKAARASQLYLPNNPIYQGAINALRAGFRTVWNETDEVRVVLLIQFKRPIRLPGKLLGDLFLTGVKHSPFVQEAKRNLYVWKDPQKTE